jgi:hypothetical protein
MDTNLTLDSLTTDNDQLERPQTQENENQIVVDAVKSSLQTLLVGESQNFRSSVAAAHRKFNHQQSLALFTTLAACVLGSLIVLASLWESRQITTKAAVALQSLQKQTNMTDPFADLRQANWRPTGKLLTQQGHTFIELKPAK